jgi:hypothetical protein
MPDGRGFGTPGGGADGSPSYPFYPSTEHFCKPAHGPRDFIDCVNLDGWTLDFICVRRSRSLDHKLTGYDSRRGVGLSRPTWDGALI